MKTLAFVVLAVVAATDAAPAAACGPKCGTDPRITLDLQDAELQNVIRLLADVGRRNVVVADDVKGKVTLKLRDVSWRTALSVVLKSGGFGVVDEDGVMWVTSQARLDAEEQRGLDMAAAREARGPLSTRVIPVNNANAKDLAAIVKPLLSKRGTVAFDERSNTLIVRDVAGGAALSAVGR